MLHMSSLCFCVCQCYVNVFINIKVTLPDSFFFFFPRLLEVLMCAVMLQFCWHLLYKAVRHFYTVDMRPLN